MLNVFNKIKLNVLLGTGKVSFSNLDPNRDYPDCAASWFLTVPLRISWESILKLVRVSSFHVISKQSFVFRHYITTRYVHVKRHR